MTKGLEKGKVRERKLVYVCCIPLGVKLILFDIIWNTIDFTFKIVYS